jgi:glycosyltransferase involved in cell wall biosynthesis
VEQKIPTIYNSKNMQKIQHSFRARTHSDSTQTDAENIIKNLNVAIVHDFLLYPGGAEKVLEVLTEMFPNAPIYTLLYDEEGMKFSPPAKGEMPGGQRGFSLQNRIRTSFLQNFPKWLRKRHRWLLPFYGTAIETLDLRDFDVVISSSGAWSKGLVTKLKTQHIAYIHSPMRYVWDYNEKYWKNLGKKPSLCVKMYLHYLRVWDRLAADRPDFLIANSQYTRRRIQKYYRRDAEVIYPPVDITNNQQPTTNNKNPKSRNQEIKHTNLESSLPLKKGEAERDLDDFKAQDKKYFLIVSRLTENKRIDVAIEAFNKLGLPLRIIGEGPARKTLEKIAQPNIQFYGWLPDEQLKQQYQNAKAFIHPSEEDFGIAAVEAMQQGIPVLAYKKGAATEIVEEGKTGELFEAQVVGVLADAVRKFLEKEKLYDAQAIREYGRQFSKERFKKEFMDFFERNIINKETEPV